MKLQEKIFYCRKKAGLSQEALAEQLGVSRQAISKWETGDAEPEINKLRLLAVAYGVTIDWLLTEDEPEEEKTVDHEPEPTPSAPSTNWIDSIPGVLGTLLRRYGWLFGVYISIGGIGFTAIGTLARYLTRRMFTGFFDNSFSDMNSMFSGGSIYFDASGNLISNAASGFATNNPVSIMGTVIIVIGIVMIITGVVLAVVLKKRGKQ
ncbi:MAG: hypothetical protein CVU91_07455 [Firmicutes bacterium HGW-Firmicutes-16]|nr:MAG: hypothetical protein CVU91_07455 [Firmicutes bacterium HGW-Firmicutes-16]